MSEDKITLKTLQIWAEDADIFNTNPSAARAVLSLIQTNQELLLMLEDVLEDIDHSTCARCARARTLVARVKGEPDETDP